MTYLADMNVLVTGASSGFGRAIALAFAKAGANLALVGRDETRLSGRTGQKERGYAEWSATTIALILKSAT